ncbi:MAG: hypothetical protein KDA61_13680 [Planctomycetales bacterium]|nr:hypothetical protein [Planctomycetales bacterium]
MGQTKGEFRMLGPEKLAVGAIVATCLAAALLIGKGSDERHVDAAKASAGHIESQSEANATSQEARDALLAQLQERFDNVVASTASSADAAKLDAAFTTHVAAVEAYREAYFELPADVRRAVGEGDAEAAAELAATTPSVATQLAHLQHCAADAELTRDRLHVLVGLLCSPAVANDLRAIVEILESDAPTTAKILEILAIVIERTLSLMLAASGEPSAMAGVAADFGNDLQALFKAAGRVANSASGSASGYCVLGGNGLPLAKLPADLAGRLADLVAQGAAIECTTAETGDGMQLVARSPAGVVQLEVRFDAAGLPLVLID